MAADLAELVGTVQRPHLRELLRRLLYSSTPTGAIYHAAPAAKYYHQAYRHGLLEHCLSVAQGVSALAATFPGIDRDVAVTGALLHDIGKVEAYASVNGAIELTDEGKLLGEIPLGYYTVRRTIEDIEAFPEADADALLHIILSHHGKLEHGSPVVPCTREATLVHFIDNPAATWGASTASRSRLPTAPSGPTSTVGSPLPPTSPAAGRASAKRLRTARSPTMVGIVLGAGASRRLGRPKQTLPSGTRRCSAMCFAMSKARRRAGSACGRPGRRTTRSLKLRRGAPRLSTTTRTGAAAHHPCSRASTPRAVAAVMLLLGDMPGVEPPLIDELAGAWAERRPGRRSRATGESWGTCSSSPRRRSATCVRSTATRRSGS